VRISLLSILLTSLLLSAFSFLPGEGKRGNRTKIAVEKGANRIAVDEEKNLILLDSEQARMYRYLAAYEYDSVVFIGGRSNRAEGFAHPVDLDLQNRQSLYVLDDALNTLFLLNINFKVVQRTEYFSLNDISGSQAALMPKKVAFASSGEQFLINRTDNRIVKINLFGEEEIRFGGPDYGLGALFQPEDISVDASGLVYVSDLSQQALKVYDLYGVYRFDFPLSIPEKWKRFWLLPPYLIFEGNSGRLYPYDLPTQNPIEGLNLSFNTDKGITDLTRDRDFFYTLSADTVYLSSLQD